MIRNISAGIIVGIILCQVSFAQSTELIEVYRNHELFENHTTEAFAIHKALIYGNTKDSTLMLFILDTTHRINNTITNEQDIRKAMGLIAFQRHSARIDTLIKISEFRTSVTFRDISYLGDNVFMMYRTYIDLYWDEKLRTTGRVVSFSSAKVPSRSIWSRGDWIDYSKGRKE